MEHSKANATKRDRIAYHVRAGHNCDLIIGSSNHQISTKTYPLEAIKISVNKQMDGYTFSITPSIRQMIKGWFPNAHPANNIFVSYDIKSDFEVYYGKLESYIYPALLGIDSQADLKKKIDEIHFIDTQTGNVLHSHKVSA